MAATATTSQATQSAKENTYEFYAGMTCNGCKNAVTKILNGTPGVTKIQADVEKKQIIVSGTVTSDVLLEKLSKWGKASKKEVRFVQQINS